MSGWLFSFVCCRLAWTAPVVLAHRFKEMFMILFLLCLCFRDVCFCVLALSLFSSWSVFFSSFRLVSLFLSLFLFYFCICFFFFVLFDLMVCLFASPLLLSLFCVNAAICKWFISFLCLFPYSVTDYHFSFVVCLLFDYSLSSRLSYLCVVSFHFQLGLASSLISSTSFRGEVCCTVGEWTHVAVFKDLELVFLFRWVVCLSNVRLFVCVSYSMSLCLSLPVWSAYDCLFVRFAAIWCFVFVSFACLCYYLR